MPTHITTQDLQALLEKGTEAAVLDLRSPLGHKGGHLAASSNIPYQELEPRVRWAVPRPGTPIVLAGDPSLDERGARILEGLGYRDVRLLDGGAAGWERSGGRLYTGTNVRSKALGEWIEHRFATPTVDAETLRKWRDAGEDVIVVDSRTTREYEHHHIPGGLHTGGGAELVYRVGQAISGPGTRVVVNCQGRTRGIVGAQSLINTGLPNEIYSLKNGTPAWQEAGYDLARGYGERLGVPAEPHPATAEWADRTLTSLGAASLGAARLDALLRDETRTVYLLDVRSAEEHAAGHPPGAVWAPGGQLVQAVDEYVVVRGAHVVLVDSPDRIRAANTANWLRYLHDGPVSVVAPGIPVTAVIPPFDVPDVEYATWREAATAGHRVFDLRHSDDYAAGHIRGSVHARRETLDRLVAEDGDGTFLLVGDETFSPEYVAADLSGRGARVTVLRGGAAAAGRDLTADDPVFADGIQDRVGPPEFGPERDAWYREYFEWELSLPARTAGDPLFDFDRIAS